jgi:hypothetical protein
MVPPTFTQAESLGEQAGYTGYSVIGRPRRVAAAIVRDAPEAAKLG